MRHVRLRILPIGNGQTAFDEPGAEILLSEVADRDEPLPSVAFLANASNVSMTNLLGKRVRRLLTAAPLRAVCARAALARLRRVRPLQLGWPVSMGPLGVESDIGQRAG